MRNKLILMDTTRNTSPTLMIPTMKLMKTLMTMTMMMARMARMEVGNAPLVASKER
jgi:hypothetical protein